MDEIVFLSKLFIRRSVKGFLVIVGGAFCCEMSVIVDLARRKEGNLLLFLR